MPRKKRTKKGKIMLEQEPKVEFVIETPIENRYPVEPPIVVDPTEPSGDVVLADSVEPSGDIVTAPTTESPIEPPVIKKPRYATIREAWMDPANKELRLFVDIDGNPRSGLSGDGIEKAQKLVKEFI
jgi:hypothetical protein